MRIALYGALIFISANLLCGQGIAQTAKNPAALKEGDMCNAMVRLFQKGGVVVINPSLSVAVRSSKNDRNELFLLTADGKEQSWKGKSVTKPEVVIVYQVTVYEDNGWFSSNLPDQFDLSKSSRHLV